MLHRRLYSPNQNITNVPTPTTHSFNRNHVDMRKIVVEELVGHNKPLHSIFHLVPSPSAPTEDSAPLESGSEKLLPIYVSAPASHLSHASRQRFPLPPSRSSQPPSKRSAVNNTYVLESELAVACALLITGGIFHSYCL